MVRTFLHDSAALMARADEVAGIVAQMGEFPQSLEIPVTRYDVAAGYAKWAPRYDGPNPAIEAEEPIFTELVTSLGSPGTALDAACGTGRHAALLRAQGWNVIGVDATPEMLDQAREKLPDADLRQGRLEALPVEDASVDLVVSGLALTHVDDIAPVYAEFARVLRPGGHVITTDMHPVATTTSGMAAFPTGEEGFAIHYVPNLVHHVSEYVQAMTAAGLTILDCREPVVDDAIVERFPSHMMFPEATRGAFLGLPWLLIWYAEKPSL